jgi:hypothetical protein
MSIRLVEKAEKVLENMLDMDEEDEAVFEGKKTGVKSRTAAIVKIKQDSAKFVAERLAKKEWSAQQGIDVTSGGEKLTEKDTANLLSSLACAVERTGGQEA